MKILFSKHPQEKDGYICITNLNTIDLIVEDGEATEIILDNYLSGFIYNESHKALKKVLSKLRINGKIIIYNPDVDMICFEYTKNNLDEKTLNDILFDGSVLGSFWSMETLCDLLKQNNIQILTKKFVNQTLAVITGVRNA